MLLASVLTIPTFGKSMTSWNSPRYQARALPVHKHLMLALWQLCIMCGCDYLENIPGLGFKTILGLFQKHKHFDRVSHCQSAAESLNEVSFCRSCGFWSITRLEGRSKWSFQLITWPILRERWQHLGCPLRNAYCIDPTTALCTTGIKQYFVISSCAQSHCGLFLLSSSLLGFDPNLD